MEENWQKCSTKNFVKIIGITRIYVPLLEQIMYNTFWIRFYIAEKGEYKCCTNICLEISGTGSRR